MYKADNFSHLCAIAGQRPDFYEDLEDSLSRGMARLSQIDSRRWISFLLGALSNHHSPRILEDSYESRMLKMFYRTLWPTENEFLKSEDPYAGVRAIQGNPVLCAEMIELLEILKDKINFVDKALDLGFKCPLDLHCQYSRDQILTAFDFENPSAMREGVLYIPEKKADLFFVTLHKSEKHYSSTTMYEDYSLNDLTFHWQSQSTTSESSPTGQRYIHHDRLGSDILLFVREQRKDPILTNVASPYTFLGKAHYLSHQGESPMSILLRLEEPIPAKFIKKTRVARLS